MILLSSFLLAGCLAVSAASDHVTAGALAAAFPGLEALPPETPLTLAPAPGVRRVFRIPELRRIAARFAVPAPEAEICVERPVAPLDPDTLLEIFKKALPDARIELLDFSHRPVPAGSLEFPASGLREGVAGSLWTGSVRYGGTHQFAVWARVKVLATVRRVVALGDLPSGQAITTKVMVGSGPVQGLPRVMIDFGTGMKTPLTKDDRERLLEYLRSAGALDKRAQYHGSTRRGYAIEPGAGDLEGGLVADGDDFVDVVPAQNVGHKAGADALYLVGRRLATREDWAVRRFYSNSFKGRLLRLDVLADTSDGPACADAGDQDIGTPVGVIPNLGSGGFEVNFGVGGVVKLLRHETVWGLGENLLGFGDRALHSVWTGSENDFRAKGKEQHAPLKAHGFRHGENEFVASGGCHESQSYAGVAAGRLDQHGFAGLDFPCALGLRDHADADAILHAGAGILAFQFRHHLGGAAFCHFVQPDQRSVANQFGDVICDLHSRLSLRRFEFTTLILTLANEAYYLTTEKLSPRLTASRSEFFGSLLSHKACLLRN